MGGVPTKHHTRSKTGKRRSHMALKPANLIPCPECKFPTLPHRACPECGFYKGKKKGK
ncbi:MAG: 50S ribosomal protein L32 [Candidatus Parcubacteria bacterium]|nr:50S ribosomal protein L32 [Patescibacteria group bacterium]BCX16237.1 MAG: 50S ribosomal protein L32 [Candidatus Parcubacteria bacterium]